MTNSAAAPHDAEAAPLTGTLPWTRSCFVCGAHNPRGFQLRVRIENGRVAIAYRTLPTDVGYRRIVHGGILATLLDETMAWAAIVAAGRLCVAAEITIRMRRPVTVGQLVRVEAWHTKADSRLVLTRGRVTGPDGAELMSAQGKYLPMSGEETAMSRDDFVPDPDSIPPDRILRPHARQGP